MRLFIAIELPQKIQKELYEKTAPIRASLSGVRWIPPENLHLTLKFLGEVASDRVDAVKASLQEALSRGDFRPFGLEFKGVGAFPSISHPRVIWIGISQGGEALTQLANALEEELQNLGFERENRLYTAHLSIGRIGHLKDRKILEEIVSKYDKTSFAGFSTDVVALIQSVLCREGAQYRKIYEVKCHPERSEGSCFERKIFRRYAPQDDKK